MVERASSSASSDDVASTLYDIEENLLPSKKYESSNGYYPLDHAKAMQSRRRCWPSLSGITAVLSLCLNAGLLALVYNGIRESKFGSFENGFSTDMEPAKPAIEAVRIPFTGELKRHDNGTLYRDMPGPEYFGEPNEEIDYNWGRLIYASGLDLNEEEITQTGLKDTTWQEPQGGLWRTGLDVFHQLHCLNMVRKSFYPEYYNMLHDVNIDDPPRLRNMHRDHCLDYLRQAIMCNADATPVRLQWDHQSHFLIPKFDQLHTCRNFELLHSWGRARALEKTHDESTRLIDEMKKQGVL